MIVSIHQPQYLPWLGYFDKIDRADVFCFLDNVQYKKNEWQNRNRIKTAAGWQWLTVPVHYRFGEEIREIEIDRRSEWRRRHLQAIRTNYGSAPFFCRYIGFFEELYEKDWKYLCDLNIWAVENLCALLEMGTVRTIRASNLALRNHPTDRLIDICLHLGADTYLAGAGGAAYMDLARFNESDIPVCFQDFDHPIYPQLFGHFESHLSIVDLLMNHGPDSIGIIRGEQNRRGGVCEKS